MAWPPVVHQDVQDEVSILRGGDISARTGVALADRNGDNVAHFNTWTGQRWDLRVGSAVAPAGGGGSSVKISRTENITDLAAQMGGNAVDNEANSALHVAVRSVAGSLGQGNAILGTAIGAPNGTDVVGVQGLGRITGGTGIGTGAYLEGRRDVVGSRAAGVEVRVQNEGGADAGFNVAGMPGTVGLWVTTGSSAGHNSAAGVSLGTGNGGSKFLAGFQVTQGAVADSAFRDESGAGSSFHSVGNHTHGLNLSEGVYAGFAILLPPSTAAGGGISFANDAFLFRNKPGGIYLDAAGGIEFNGNFTFTDGRDFVIGPTKGSRFGIDPGQKIGFFGAVPVVRPIGVAVTATAIHAALVSLGLIAA